VFRHRAPLNEKPNIVGLNDFTTPSRWRTKVLGGLLISGPAVTIILFALGYAHGVKGPVHLVFWVCALCIFGGLVLFIARPKLTDEQIWSIGILGSLAVGMLVILSPNALWVPAFPALFIVILTVAHLFLSRHVAFLLHGFVIAICIGAFQITSPSLHALVSRDLVNSAWATVIGVTVSLIRRHLDKSVQLLFIQANQDPLTQLHNRLAFTTTVDAALHDRDEKGQPRTAAASVFLLDLDRFKKINDTMGHAFGDSLLKQVSSRLNYCVETIDGLRGGTVARLGGDEFAVFAPRVLDDELRRSISVSLRHHITDRFQVDGVNVAVDISVGSATFPDHGISLSQLLHHADIAMYQAKIARNRSQSIELEPVDSGRRTRLLQDLDHAVSTDQLTLHYQPKIRVADGRTCGVEALLRWRHPEFGYIAPDEFIPLSEGTGLIGPLTTQVLRMAAQQTAEWEKTGLELNVAVNISGRSLADRDFPKEIAKIYETAGVDPRRLTLEVSETAMMHDVRPTDPVLSEIRAMGIRISIGNFGTGHCSLTHLYGLAVDELKIDRSLVSAIGVAANTVIVRTALQLAHNLGLSVVAEGVESQTSLDALRLLECDFMQGYHFARAMPANEATLWLLQDAAAVRAL
jgi:diguanylate cyclase (GGDEF)-like protein